MSSLTSGPTFKNMRLAKTLSVLSGGLLTFATGSQATFAGTSKLLLTPKANPATCTPGELSVSSTGNKLVICSASNTWTVVGTQT